jgi:hypothetical protein
VEVEELSVELRRQMRDGTSDAKRKKAAAKRLAVNDPVLVARRLAGGWHARLGLVLQLCRVHHAWTSAGAFPKDLPWMMRYRSLAAWQEAGMRGLVMHRFWTHHVCTAGGAKPQLPPWMMRYWSLASWQDRGI